MGSSTSKTAIQTSLIESHIAQLVTEVEIYWLKQRFGTESISENEFAEAWSTEGRTGRRASASGPTGSHLTAKIERPNGGSVNPSDGAADESDGVAGNPSDGAVDGSDGAVGEVEARSRPTGWFGAPLDIEPALKLLYESVRVMGTEGRGMARAEAHAECMASGITVLCVVKAIYFYTKRYERGPGAGIDAERLMFDSLSLWASEATVNPKGDTGKGNHPEEGYLHVSPTSAPLGDEPPLASLVLESPQTIPPYHLVQLVTLSLCLAHLSPEDQLALAGSALVRWLEYQLVAKRLVTTLTGRNGITFDSFCAGWLVMPRVFEPLGGLLVRLTAPIAGAPATAREGRPIGTEGTVLTETLAGHPLSASRNEAPLLSPMSPLFAQLYTLGELGPLRSSRTSSSVGPGSGTGSGTVSGTSPLGCHVPLYTASTHGFSIRQFQSKVFQWNAPTILIVSGKRVTNPNARLYQAFLRDFPVTLPESDKALKLIFAVAVNKPWKLSKNCFGDETTTIYQLSPRQEVFKGIPAREDYAYFSVGGGLGFGLKVPVVKNGVRYAPGGVSLTLENTLEYGVFRCAPTVFRGGVGKGRVAGGLSEYSRAASGAVTEGPSRSFGLGDSFASGVSGTQRRGDYEDRFRIQDLEVFGVGGRKEVEEQRKRWAWEEREAMERRGVKVGRGLDEERAFLEMAGLVGGYAG